jgi:hypothetical protein
MANVEQMRMIEATLAIILSGMCGLYFIHRLTDGGYKGGFKINIAKIRKRPQKFLVSEVFLLRISLNC